MTVEIQLTKGQVAIVSDEDADLAQFKWHAFFDTRCAGGGKFRVRRRRSKIQGGGHETLSRAVLERMLGRPLLRSELADHVNRDPLLNTRSNLRLATHSQNAMNKGKQRDNTSGYKGVTLRKDIHKWKAQIVSGGKHKCLGYFDTPEEAYVAYCEAAIELHGEFAHLG